MNLITATMSVLFLLGAVPFISSSATEEDREATARSNTSGRIDTRLAELECTKRYSVFLLISKQERTLEAWVKKGTGSKYVLFRSFPVLAASGKLGPKRREGDKQVPEGFYNIDTYNPKSNFHLSMRVNYPNAADRVLSDQQHPGSDIYLHGGRKSIGCVAIGDPGIEELYTLCRSATNSTSIQVLIVPFGFESKDRAKLPREFAQHKRLWAEIEAIYRYFRATHGIPEVVIDSRTGEYNLVK